MFPQDVKGRGSVSLIEDTPLSALGDKGNGRHFMKRYHIKIEGFRIMPGTLPNNDDPLYLYLLREPLNTIQAARPWTLNDNNELVSAHHNLRQIYDTKDAELILFDQGVAGALRGGDLEQDRHELAARRVPIEELLRRAGGENRSRFAFSAPAPMAVHARALRSRGITTAADLLKPAAVAGEDEDDRRMPIDDAGLADAGLSPKEIAKLHQVPAFVHAQIRFQRGCGLPSTILS
jgi:hypothetical protein